MHCHKFKFQHSSLVFKNFHYPTVTHLSNLISLYILQKVLHFSHRESLLLFFFFWSFLGLLPWYMEVPRLGVQSELQLPAYPTATETRDPGHVCDPPYSSQQRRILNPLSKARDQTCVLMDISQVHNLLSHSSNAWSSLLNHIC